MKRTHLRQFVADRGQVDSAYLLGVTQGAISKALRVGRAIYVMEHKDGTFSAEELRSFPSLSGHRPSEPPYELPSSVTDSSPSLEEIVCPHCRSKQSSNSAGNPSSTEVAP